MAQESSRPRIGEGRIGSSVCAAIGVLSVAAVLCLRYPAFLTTPELRVHYDVELLRLTLAIAMVVGAWLGVVGIVLGGPRVRAAIGLSGLLLAMLLGGPYVPTPDFAQPRFYLMVLAAFATAALLLSAIGVYGIIAYTVRQRTKEIGVRMALGASAGQIVRMVVGEGLSLAAFGLALGVTAAMALTGQLSALLFGVDARDGVTFVAVIGVLVLAAVVACVMPARSAARLGPQEALRGE